MAAVDALSLDAGTGGPDWKRWTIAGAAVLAAHLGAVALLSEAPPPTNGAAETAIEMDLAPPPSAGAAQMPESGAEQTQPLTPEEADDAKPQEVEQLDEVEDTPAPEEQPVTAEAAPVEDVQEAQPVETDVVAADDVKTPDDVEAAVALPPERTVVAQEETPEPPKPVAKPVTKPVTKRETPKPVERKPREKPAERTAEKPKPASIPTQAGGQRGASADAGASRAAAAAYGSKIRAAVAAQKRAGTTFSGRAMLTFTVNRAGRISGVSASGPAQAAAEAQAMLRRAAGSFPPMPSDMPGASKTYSLPINFSAR